MAEHTYAELIARAEAGDELADHALIVEAAAGSIECQRAILDAMLLGEGGGNLGTIIRAEVLARFVAARGHEPDKLRLALLLFIVAEEVEAREMPNAASAAKEAFSILQALADSGYAEALEALRHLTPSFPEVWASLDAAIPTAEIVPERHDVTALDRAVPAPTLEEFLASLPPVTRWERVKWWLSDRWWSLRHWPDNRCWDARFAWWKIKDAVIARRNGWGIVK